jgi:hypothetical protein
MTIKQTLAKLQGLYEKTNMDWEIYIRHSLTEPTCPSVVISPEGMEVARYRVDTDSIEEGIEKAVDLVYREVILGEQVSSYAPFTDPDDKRLEELLAKWRK